MQNVQARACAASGVALEEAFTVDEVNLYERLGEETLKQLSTNFYNAVFEDDAAPWFKSIFAASDKAVAIENQWTFLVQRFGGPQLYSQRKGHPALIGRHVDFRMTHAGAKRWIEHMAIALAETPGIDDDSRRRMMAYFRHTAYFLVLGVADVRARRKLQQQQQEQEQQQQQQQQGQDVSKESSGTEHTQPSGKPEEQEEQNQA